MFKAIIIGCGKIAGNGKNIDRRLVNSHAAAYTRTPGIRLVDCIDIKLQKARGLAKKYHCGSYGTDFIASINRTQPDVVSICTPDNTHFSIAKSILAHKVVPAVIFLEKPACSTMKEYSYLRTKARKRGVVIVVNHSRRFHDGYRKLRGLIRKKIFGEPVRLDVFYYGGFKHNGVHVIDTLLYLFGDRLKRRGAENHAYSFVKSRAAVYLHAFDEKYYQIFDFDLKFEKARLRIENFESRFLLQKKRVNSLKENVLEETAFDWPVNKRTPLKNAVDIITRYLKTRDSSCIHDYTLEAAEDTMRIIVQAGK